VQGEEVLDELRSRVLRLCRRRGLMLDEGELDVGGGAQQQEQGLLPLIHAASIQGRVALGPEAGKSIARLRRTPAARKYEAVVFKELCAELDGFSLHAGVRIKAQETSRLEHLCRYVLRPPLSVERLSLTGDGRLSWRLRAPFRDRSPSKHPTGVFRSAFGGPGLAADRRACPARANGTRGRT